MASQQEPLKDVEQGGSSGSREITETSALLTPKSLVDKKRVNQQEALADLEASLKVYQEQETKLAAKYLQKEKDKEAREKAHLKRQDDAARDARLQKESNSSNQIFCGIFRASGEAGDASEAERKGKAPQKAEGEDQLPKKAESGQPQDPQPDVQLFTDIKNLLLIDKSLIHSKALESWTSKEKLLSSRLARKISKEAELKNEVYQLLGFFSVFQGVVLTVVSQANLLRCDNKWSPIVLSVLASVVTLAAITQKLWQIWLLQDSIYSEDFSYKSLVNRIQELQREGPNFKFSIFPQDQKIITPKKDYFRLYSFTILAFLAVFTLIFPISHWRILCYPGACSCSTGPPPA